MALLKIIYSPRSWAKRSVSRFQARLSYLNNAQTRPTELFIINSLYSRRVMTSFSPRKRSRLNIQITSEVIKLLVLLNNGFTSDGENCGWRKEIFGIQLTLQKRQKRSQDFARSIFAIPNNLYWRGSRDFARFRNYTATAVRKLIPQLLGEN